MSKTKIRVLALDLDGTLTNDEKIVTPRTRAALDAAAAQGVTIVLASGRPTAGVLPLAKELGLDKKGGCILSYNGGKIIDCRTEQTLVQHAFPADLIEPVCTFSRYWNVVPLTYDKNGIVTEVPDAPYVLEEARINKIPVRKVENLPAEIQWRMVGELYNTYIIVEQGDDAFLIDKHAAHERILFEKLKAHPEKISAQSLLSPIPVRLSPAAAGELLANADMLDELGFAVEEFGENTVLLRQIPMDLSPDDAAEAVESLSADLLSGRRESKDTVRDELLHTVACKAAIKAGWVNDEQELLAVAKEVMSREDLKYCPHGRPICVSLSKKQLEKQFKRV